MDPRPLAAAPPASIPEGDGGTGAHERDAPLGQSLRPRGPVQFEVSAYERSANTVIAVNGELDILTAPRFSALVDELVRRRASDIIVDLTGTRFIDSAGLHILLNAERRMARRSRSLAVICPAGPVRRVFELSRLVEPLHVTASFRDYESAPRSAGATAAG